MSVEYKRVMTSPIGRLVLCADERGLARIEFHAQGIWADEHPILAQAQREIEEYFAGRRSAFSVPLSMRGTAFQMQVWRALMEIPYGETCTYGDIARRIGNDRAFRAVGMACNRNCIPIIVPCHRVVGMQGRLTGYAGGLEIKQALLNLEKSGR